MNRVAPAFAVAVLWIGLAGCGGGSGGNKGTPVLSVAMTSLSFSAVVGLGNDPAPAMVSVTNTGTGGAINFTSSSDASWLMVTPSTGATPGTLTITAVRGNMAAGTYTGHVTVTSTGAQGSPATITATFMVNPQASSNPFWPQWGSNPQHTGMVTVTGQSLTNKLADIVYDPHVDKEKAEFGGELVVHEQTPVIDGNDVYMVVKTGIYNSCMPVGSWQNGTACGPNSWNTVIWNERRFSWINGQLTPIWTFQSDWVPEPNAANFNVGAGGLQGWEPVFHPIEANNFIYVPGAAGTVWKVEKTGGTSTSHINPLSGVNGVTAANTFVSGPLSADSNGNVYYNVIELNLTGGDPWGTNDVLNAWLVKIMPSDVASKVSYAALVPDAPPGDSMSCPGTFAQMPNAGTTLPWPPSTGSTPPFFPGLCGSQRPGVNIAPAIAPDGTIYTGSRAHFDAMVSYLVAVNSNLTPKWAASLQNVLNDGCGVIVPIGPTNTTPNACRVGALMGVDPTTNAKGSGSIVDQASSSPTVLPDGSVLFGALDNYNAERGHLFHFDSAGNFLNSFFFGWDSTPGVWVHGQTYSIVIKDNHYNAPQYCFLSSPSNTCQSLPAGPYYITQLDSSMNIEWQFQNTTNDSTHSNGYEWCINMPAIDSAGNVYVNSEDGNIYQLPQGHSGVFTTPGGKMFLNIALGAAYTPLSIGPDGKLYTQNNGHLFVVGN